MGSKLWRRPPPVSCPEVLELLTDYLEDALAPSDAAQLTTHLDRCVSCGAYLVQLRATIRTLGAVPLPALPDETCAELLAAFRAESAPRANG